MDVCHIIGEKGAGLNVDVAVSWKKGWGQMWISNSE